MIKPPLSVKSCGICLWNLLAAGSGLLERLAKSKGLSSMCLTWNQHFAPHHTPPFATGVHSPFRSFQTSLWIESPYNIISLFVFLLTCTTYTMHITTRCISALPRNARNSLHSEEPSTLCRITQASPALTVGVAASLGWWGWSPESLCHHGCHPGGHCCQLRHLGYQPWRGRGEAKCAGGQGTWWEGSGRQLGSKPLGAEAWERAHWPVLHTWPGKKVTEFSMSGLETKTESMIDVVWCNVTRQYRVNVLICSNDCPVECLLILLPVSVWQDGEFKGILRIS